MKKQLLSFIVALSMIVLVQGQVPQKFNYQGVARSSNGAPLVNKSISLRISILDGSGGGPVVYMETQSATTNQFGLFSLAVGAGTVIVGNISTVAWSSGDKYIRIEMDPDGGTAYNNLGTAQLLSVPYAMYAMTPGGPAGPAGPQGPTGPQGPAGPQGPPGAGSLSGTVNKLVKFTNATVGGDSQISDDGNLIGIGATTALGSEKFRFNQTVTGAAYGGMNISTTSATGLPFLSFANNNSLLGWMYFDGSDANKFKIYNSGVRLTLTATGKMGLGTSAPASALHIKMVDNSWDGGINLEDDATATEFSSLVQGSEGLFLNSRTSGNDIYFLTNLFPGVGTPAMIIKDGGYVGVGEVNPTAKFQVTHPGATGILCQSAVGSGSYSVIDNNADNGDAALRFQRAGVLEWNVRNDPATDNLQIFELGGGGERMQIQNTTGNVGIGITPTAKLHVGGSFTATGVKAFTIDHPLDPENKMLRHFSIESPDVLNLYSGTVTSDANGHVTVQLPDYFESINKDYRYQLTVIGTFAQAIISKEINGNQFEISTSQPNVKVSWEVTGIRNDGYMKYVNTMQAEEMKPSEMRGKYFEPKAFNLPENRSVNYIDDVKTKGTSLDATSIQSKPVAKVVQSTGTAVK